MLEGNWPEMNEIDIPIIAVSRCSGLASPSSTLPSRQGEEDNTVLQSPCYLKRGQMRSQGSWPGNSVIGGLGLSSEVRWMQVQVDPSYPDFVICTSYLASLCPRILFFDKKELFIWNNFSPTESWRNSTENSLALFTQLPSMVTP